jgi:hypothetical protein
LYAVDGDILRNLTAEEIDSVLEIAVAALNSGGAAETIRTLIGTTVVDQRDATEVDEEYT